MPEFLTVATTVWGLVMALAPALQIRLLVKTKDSSTVSASWMVILVVGYVLWLSYGIVFSTPPLIIANVVSAIVGMILLALIVYYRHPRSRQAETVEVATATGLPPGMSAEATYTVRDLAVTDVERVLDAFVSDPQMTRQGNVRDRASALTYITALMGNDAHAVVSVDHDDLLLALAAVTIDRDNASGWVFYWAHPDARGRGATIAAVRHLRDWCFTAGLDRLELGYRVNNPASARVARRTGFIEEGLERGKFLIDGQRIDAVMASMLATDPRP